MSILNFPSFLTSKVYSSLPEVQTIEYRCTLEWPLVVHSRLCGWCPHVTLFALLKLSKLGGLSLTLNPVHILHWVGEVRGNILTQPPPPPPHIQYSLPRICFRTIF